MNTQMIHYFVRYFRGDFVVFPLKIKSNVPPSPSPEILPPVYVIIEKTVKDLKYDLL